MLNLVIFIHLLSAPFFYPFSEAQSILFACINFFCNVGKKIRMNGIYLPVDTEMVNFNDEQYDDSSNILYKMRTERDHAHSKIRVLDEQLKRVQTEKEKINADFNGLVCYQLANILFSVLSKC